MALSFRGQSEWCSDVANSAPVRVTEISSRNLLSGLQPITTVWFCYNVLNELEKSYLNLYGVNSSLLW
jgi:hypothetical protein